MYKIAQYFPFAIAGLNWIQGGSIWSDLIGIGVGHSYVYLKEILPLSHRMD